VLILVNLIGHLTLNQFTPSDEVTIAAPEMSFPIATNCPSPHAIPPSQRVFVPDWRWTQFTPFVEVMIVP
jgi:hypothetical protein